MYSDRTVSLYTICLKKQNSFKCLTLIKQYLIHFKHQINQFCDLLYMLTMKFNFLQYQQFKHIFRCHLLLP